MIVRAEWLRAEYDGRWYIRRLVCPVCRGHHTSLHPEVAQRAECPYCHTMIRLDVVLTVARVVNLDDGDFEFKEDGNET